MLSTVSPEALTRKGSLWGALSSFVECCRILVLEYQLKFQLDFHGLLNQYNDFVLQHFNQSTFYFVGFGLCIAFDFHVS